VPARHLIKSLKHLRQLGMEFIVAGIVCLLQNIHDHFGLSEIIAKAMLTKDKSVVNSSFIKFK